MRRAQSEAGSRVYQKMQTWPVQTLRSERQGAATTLLERIFGRQVFQFPKPLSLMQALVRACSGEGDIVLDFFAGSGTTAHAVLAQNAEDEGDRRFIMVSNTEVTADEPEKNLCRDVCAERIRRVIDGYGDVVGLGGDFAYLQVRRIAEEDVLYDLDPCALWTLFQLRQDHFLKPFDPAATAQLSRPPRDTEEADDTRYAPHMDQTVAAMLTDLAGAIDVFTPTPGILRDATQRPGTTIELIPDSLLAEFRRNLAGL